MHTGDAAPAREPHRYDAIPLLSLAAGRWRRHERRGVSGSVGGGERGWGHGHVTEPERYIGQRKTRGLTECTRPGNIRPTLWRCHDFFYMKSPSARPRRPSQCASTAVTQWSQSNSP